MTRKDLVAIAAVLLVSQAAFADDDSLEKRILACTEELDDAQRLACYDREAGAPPKAIENAVAENEPPPASTETEVEQFGMTAKLARSKPEIERQSELREISATAIKVSKNAYGGLVVTLDNGQIWTEKSPKSGFRVKVDDTVVIKKGEFSGGYRMYGSRQSSQVRRID